MAKSLLEQLHAAMDVLERRYGSQNAAAKACGVSHQSWGQWRRGSFPRPGTADRILAMVKK